MEIQRGKKRRAQLIEAADAFEEKLNAQPELDDIRLTPEMEADMARRIASLKDGNNKIHTRRRRRALRTAGVMAAALAVILGVGMTSEARRLWLVSLWNVIMGRETVSEYQTIDEAEEESYEIIKMLAEIEEQTGIHAVRFMYMPEGLTFDYYVVEENPQKASMFYRYGDTILAVHMVKELQNTLQSNTLDGEIIKTIPVETEYYGTVQVMELESPLEENNYAAQFLYEDCQYMIHGVLPREEFIKLVENMQIS